MTEKLPAADGATTDRIGKYEVILRLGQGAMGQVYLAEDPHVGRHVAIKVMTAAGSEDRQRFLHEARIVGSLSHPHIVVLYEFGFHDERPYLVLEYLPGVSLETWLRTEHSLAEHLQIAEGLLSALVYAHSQGVLHRDLKPSNVQVLPSGACKIMDFGIARAATGKLTATGTVMGTPAYMAPEIVGDAQYSTRADTYSAALVLYEMLAGGNPFLGQTLPATLHNILLVDPPPLAELRPGLPRELCDGIMAYLARDPERRPSDLGPLLSVVGRLRMSHATTDAMVPSADIQMTRTIVGQYSTRRRRRRRLHKAAMALGVAVAGGVAAWWGGGDRAPSPDSSAPASVPAPPPAEPSTAVSPPPTLAAATAAPTLRRPAAPVSPPAPATLLSSVPTPAASVEPTAAAVEMAATVAAALATPAPEPVVLSSLVAVDPRTARRGAMVDLRLRGTGLRPDQRAGVLRGRDAARSIHITRQTFVDPTTVRLTVLVDEDAPIGLYSVVLTDDGGGTTNSLTLEVIL